MIQCRVEAWIHKDRLIENLKALLNKVKPNEVLAMIKGNAYGHGLIEVASIIHPFISAFGVASLMEAKKLRQHDFDQPIILMSGFTDSNQVPTLIDLNITPVIHSQYQLEWVVNYPNNWQIDAWLKINSGMNRLGFAPEAAEKVYQTIKAHPERFKRLIWLTHLAEAEYPDSLLTKNQKEKFSQIYHHYPADAVSIENSAGLLMDETTPCDIIRPGAALYGISSFQALTEKTRQYFSYVMTLKSKIIALHELKEGQTVGYNGIWQAKADAKIAILSMGYADGYPYQTPEGTPVLIHGQKVPIIGKVSMDMMAVDVTKISNVKVGDEVILWGDDLPVEEVASVIGVSPYSLVSGLSERVKRKVV